MGEGGGRAPTMLLGGPPMDVWRVKRAAQQHVGPPPRVAGQEKNELFTGV